MLISFDKVINTYNLQPKGIIHVGGHFAEEIDEYYKNGVQRTIWVEANPEAFDILKNKVSNYPNAIALNECVSNKDGEQIGFHISNNGQSSSILELSYHKIAHPDVHYTKTLLCTTKTIDTIFAELTIPNKLEYTFLNADIQGAELMMLQGGTKLLDQLNCLYLEVNDREVYKDCGLIGELDNFLNPFGFIRMQTEMYHNTGWGDAVYIKSKNN